VTAGEGDSFCYLFCITMPHDIRWGETWSIFTKKANAKRSKGKGSASLRSLCPHFHTTIIAPLFVSFVSSFLFLHLQGL
jgi:hypothetical protein